MNGAVAGAGGTTPGGTWDAAGLHWNALSDGTGSTGTWVGGNTAVFAAGTDAKGAYTVAVGGTQDISGLRFEEGTVTLSGGTALRMTANTTADVAGALTATVSTPITQDATARQLTKTGTGTLVLAGTNNYTGATIVIAGTLSVSKLANGGENSSIGKSTNASANLLLGNDATLKYTGAGDSTDRQFTFNDSLAGLSITLDASGTGPINFTSTTGPSHTQVNQTRALNLIGSNTGENTLAANIGNNGTGVLTVVKAGTGTWVLSGVNTYTGTTTVSGGTLEIGGAGQLGSGTYPGSINITAGTFKYNSLAAQTLTGVISGPGGVSKAGTGTLVLSGANTYTGTTTVSGGTLEIGGTGQLGSGTYPGTINITAGTFKYNSSAAQTLTGVISGPGGVTKAGTGTLVLAGMNPYSGGTTVSGGMLSVASQADSALGTGPVSVLPGATLGLSRNTLSNPMTLTGATLSQPNAFGTTLSGPLTLGGMVTLSFADTGFIAFNGNIGGSGGLIHNGTRQDTVTTTLNGTNTYTGPTVINGALKFGNRVSLYNAVATSWTADKIVINSGGTAYFGVGGTGQFTASDIDMLAALGTNTGGFTNGASIGLDTSGGNFLYTSVIADTNGGANKIGLQKFGNNALTLGDDNTYTGLTSIRGGTLVVSSINSVVSGTASSSLGAPKTVADGTILIGQYGKDGVLVYTGTGETTDRVLYTHNIGANVTLDQSGVGLLKFTSNHVATGSGKTIYLQGSTAGEGEFAGSLGGTTNFKLIKRGTGTWTLSGTNLYTGTTTVSGGTLRVTGSIDTSDVTVNSTGTLSGGGSVKSLIVQTGGTVAPGDSAGKLKVVAGNVSLAADAVYEWEFNGTSGDLVSITGDLTLDDNWKLKLVDTGGAPQVGNQYDLFTYTGDYFGMSSFGLSNIDATGVSWNTANASIVAGSGRVYITGIPEPVTLGLLALGGLTVLRRRRK